MKHIKKLIISLCILFATVCHAENWVNIGSSGNQIYDMKGHSMVLGEDNAGNLIMKVHGRIVEAETQDYNEFIWYVTIADCAKGHGKFNMARPSGEFMFDTNFKFGEDKVASNISELLCKGANEIRKQEQKKHSKGVTL
jgi:hypothetical protein